MSSSTSSSDPDAAGSAAPARPSRAWRIAGCVAVVLLGLELVTRFVLLPRSKDISRFSTYDARAEELVKAPGAGPRIALIGNSSTDRGIEVDLLEEALAAEGFPGAMVDKFVADSSHINEWYYLIRRYFLDRGLVPDLFVVTFYNASLEADRSFEVGRLARYFTKPKDWPEVFSHDVTSLPDRVSFLLSNASAAYAGSGRIQERTLKAIVPDYQDFATRLTEQSLRDARYKEQGEGSQARGHDAMTRLLAALRARDARVVFNAFPSHPPEGITPYVVDPTTLKMIAEAGQGYQDLRPLSALTPNLYEDDIHLLPEGRPVYCKALAKELAKQLRSFKAK